MTIILPKVTKYQRSIAIGHILGDGYLYKNGRLQVEQSKEKKPYVEWLYTQLSNLSGKISEVQRIHLKTGKKSESCRFFTKRVFVDLESIFYTILNGKRKKLVPSNLEELLDSTTLAVWFMDDGGKSQSTPRGAYINATSFTSAERLQIQQAFQNVFDLKITIQKAGGNNQYNFYIPAGSYSLFYKLVSPTILLVPTMMYKLSDPI